MKVKIGSLVWKIVVAVIVLFLVMVAVKDFEPKQTTVAKTVTYGNK